MDILEITVYLSSTKHLISVGMETIRKSNIPIVSAVIKLDQPFKKIDRQHMKRVCRELCQYVSIDVEKKYLIISEKLNDPDSALVEYDIKNSSRFGDEFLQRWEDTKMLMFEFNLYDKKGKYIFTLKGMWDDVSFSWASLRIEKIRSIVITDHKIPETIITKGT